MNALNTERGGIASERWREERREEVKEYQKRRTDRRGRRKEGGGREAPQGC